MQLTRAELNMLIGENVRKNRLLQKMTEEDLAGKASLSLHTIKQVERGHRGCNVWTLSSLATALNMSIQSLVCSEIDMHSEIQVLINALEPEKHELARNILYAIKITKSPSQND